MKGVILYHTKYGATETYAKWLTDETGWPCLNINAPELPMLHTFDTFIIGAPIRSGRWMGAAFMQKYWWLLFDRKVLLYSVSGAPAQSPVLPTWMENSVGSEVMQKVDYIPLQGRCNLKQLTFTDRLLVKFGSIIEKEPAAKERMKYGFDFLKKPKLAPIIEWTQTKETNLEHAY